MALSKDLMGVGFPAGQATGLGGSVNVSVAAAGSTQANATAITASNVIVASADGTKGVVLPAAMPGDSVTIFNNAGSTLKVYPPSGAAIAVPGTGLGTGDASYAHTTYATATYKCLTSTQWLVNKSA